MPSLQNCLCPTYELFLQLDSYICVFLKIHFWIVALPSSRFALELIWTWWDDAREILAAEITDHKATAPSPKTPIAQQPAFNRDQKQVPRGEYKCRTGMYDASFEQSYCSWVPSCLQLEAFLSFGLTPFQGFLFHKLVQFPVQQLC